ncbi:MAG TPA: cupin domain-containing protein [Syntrophales bacterium]|nr:cupin domain-containing protein [Syntrophales bacterium]HOM06353.1 cupin domain-containing protein [Syntrophales bacterium]HON99196.1 cupin domain-containing protein [Syntrophales bacterium]HPC00304.1 cupin domain-containing protein [Syntrophales bacterium]HPQ05967.1 cupin domain-containing protein [Syntrophales bacterium]
MKITRLENVTAAPMALEGAKDVLKQVPLGKADGAPHYSFRVFTILPGGHTPYHDHPFEHMNYFIAGEGALVLEGGEERPVRAGDFVLIHPGERHRYRNTAASDLVMICAVPKEYE